MSTDLRAAVAASRQLGFTGLQFDAVTSALDFTTLSGSARREIRQVLEQQNQSLVGLRSDAGTKGLAVGVDVDRLLWRWEQILETAAGLESPLVCLDLGPLPTPAVAPPPAPTVTPDMAGLILLPTTTEKPLPQPTAPPDPAFVSQVDGVLNELARKADRYGVTVALRSDLSSLAALHRALIAANCPSFGIDLDPVSLLCDDWTIDQAFSRLAPLIRHFRGRDALSGADRRTRPAVLGKGSANWTQLLGLLDESDYHGWITIDPIELTDRPAGAIAALKYLRAQ